MPDAGCGPGIFVAQLIERGADVSGCDASARMIELARIHRVSSVRMKSAYTSVRSRAVNTLANGVT